MREKTNATNSFDGRASSEESWKRLVFHSAQLNAKLPPRYRFSLAEKARSIRMFSLTLPFSRIATFATCVFPDSEFARLQSRKLKLYKSFIGPYRGEHFEDRNFKRARRERQKEGDRNTQSWGCVDLGETIIQTTRRSWRCKFSSPRDPRNYSRTPLKY